MDNNSSSDEQNQTPVPREPTQQNGTPGPGILKQTLGNLLKNNNQAQGMVMQAMQLNPQQLQQLLNMTGNNQLMNMTIGDLLKNGTMQQAAGQAMQVSPEQFQQVLNSLNQNPQGQPVMQLNGQAVSQNQPLPILAQPPRQSFFQKLKNLFR